MLKVKHGKVKAKGASNKEYALDLVAGIIGYLIEEMEYNEGSSVEAATNMGWILSEVALSDEFEIPIGAKCAMQRAIMAVAEKIKKGGDAE